MNSMCSGRVWLTRAISAFTASRVSRVLAVDCLTMPRPTVVFWLARNDSRRFWGASSTRATSPRRTRVPSSAVSRTRLRKSWGVL